MRRASRYPALAMWLLCLLSATVAMTCLGMIAVEAYRGRWLRVALYVALAAFNAKQAFVILPMRRAEQTRD